MKTTLRKIIIFSMSVIFLAGCTQKKDVVIGISLGPNQERWQKDLDLMTERLDYAGAKVLVKEAQNDETVQAEQIEDLLKSNIDVLIIAPVNSETCGVIVNEAKQQYPDLKVIAYDRIIKNCDLDFYVSFDNIKVGELQADYLTRIKPTGKYAILGGSPKDNNSQLLKLGQMNILQPLITKGDITIVLDKFVADWNADNAYEIINNYLNQGKELDAIIASSDEIAKGASRALEEHDLCRNVLLSGQDAQADACKRIAEGKQTMTVYKYIESLAHSTANIAMLMAKDEPVPNSFVTMNNGEAMVPALLLPSMIQVHKGNIRMTVIADGYLDRKEVFGDEE
ncbi:sugar ABC transporter substrate-binding protein [Saccharicrinis sp. FJH54]|uniref:sugar ABC transporter substrate-binding protein n=1 Tax=Saccharicrinis sp. FJH54 TaxID=3344665 RepID=UPI0035D4D0D1